MVPVDLDALRPMVAEVEFVAGLLVEVGPATGAELGAHFGLPLATVGGALLILERADLVVDAVEQSASPAAAPTAGEAA